MIPINIGLDTGTGFGSSVDLTRIQEVNDKNYRAYQSYYAKNPVFYPTDNVFFRFVTMLKEYEDHKLRIEPLIPNLCLILELVHHSMPQVLHPTHLGNLLLIPIYNDGIDLFTVLYSDATDLNYGNIIDTTSFVTVNVKLLASLVKMYTRRSFDIYRLLTKEITIPLFKAITDYAVFNVITNIKTVKKASKPNHPFYMENLNRITYMARRKILNSVNGLDTNPPDVLRSLPLTFPMRFNVIEDSYINNLIWLNLISFHKIIANCSKINREQLYVKYYRNFKLYKPNGRGDSYFSSASSELLDYLEKIKFI